MFRVSSLCAFAAIGALTASAASAGTVVVNVGAESDIFLAGQTSVPTDFPYNPSAPGAPGDGAGALPVPIGVTAGETLDITASGLASCCYGVAPYSGPAGLGGTSSISGYGNVAAYSGPQFPLVGVFGGPTLGTSWSIFVIGAADTLTVPTGATTLYLGLPDSLGFNDPPGYYNDNTGSFTVDVSGVPEPAAWALMLAGFAGLGVALRANRRGVAALRA
jgi:hypothetical protein